MIIPIIILLISNQYKMHKCTIKQFVKLDLNAPQNNFRTITITFQQQNLENLLHQLPSITSKISDKLLTKCYLVPNLQSIPKNPKYQAVLLGGTFDYFHLGHQLLLLTALYHAEKKILVGVTSDAMLVKKKNKQIIQPLQVRIKQVQNYIKMIKPNIEIIIAELTDPYGSAIYTKDYQAIIVSDQTKIGAIKINQIRQSNNLHLLHVEQCPLLIQDSHQNEKMSKQQKVQDKISSSQIREYVLLKNKMNLEQIVQYKGFWNEMYKNLLQYIPQKHQQNKESNKKLHFLYSQTWFNKILQQYSEYWRHYHTNRHIFQMLQQYKSFEQVHDGKLQKLSKFGKLVIQLGIWFHDAEYWVSKADNQQASAKLAVQFIQGVTQEKSEELEELAKRVSQAILATKHHKTNNFQIKVLIDLDMSILNSEHNKYAQYAESIKKQYQPIAKDQYAKKRIQFLKTLNPKEVLYFKQGDKIQENIKWEIQMLQKKQSIEKTLKQKQMKKEEL